ncbi:4-hydroxybenzoate synthetase [Paenibacillus allorhizosphaerae]|uniref:4-hydroxybenzoate synthetase n=1 Tax=Paenibacillus allorhizosphaerae TaxID=2849866 RepID=A0ABM8VED3_9BACL|nr:4-hydroxybenzoate synthetase [Paenibacillus allorhizosphaerae]CAG7630574.1 hypothetical protein PAECIP111802_01651 [Paenibacillus allorhizosphaerae]
MTNHDSMGIDPQDAGKALHMMQELIFDILLATDGRTTDLLETILNEKTLVTVLRQEQAGGKASGRPVESPGVAYYVRESLLSGKKSGFIVSHNIALVHSKHVPPALFEKIASRQEGIGKAISSMGLQSFRKVEETGRRNGDEAVDLLGQPVSLRFPELRERVPFKKYVIYFGHAPGIEMLEYFNPGVIRHRLKQMLNRTMEG